MSVISIVLEHAENKLRPSCLSGITFGCMLKEKTGGALHALVIGKDVKAVAQEASFYGAEKIWTVEATSYEHYLAETYTHIVTSVAKSINATTIAAASTTMSKDFLPRVAARLNAGMASDVMSVESADSFKRPMWAGNIIATVQINTEIKVCTVRTTEFAQATKQSSASSIEACNVPTLPAPAKTEFINFKAVKSERPELTSAQIVVSGGRGVKGPEGFQLIEQLADTLGAAVGASRAVCDAGWVPNDLQVGQTGKVVAPNLYIAVGISGAIQHLAGMKSSKVIVAINKDPEAPIFQLADYGLVGDLFKIVPEMIAALKK